MNNKLISIAFLLASVFTTACAQGHSSQTFSFISIDSVPNIDISKIIYYSTPIELKYNTLTDNLSAKKNKDTINRLRPCSFFVDSILFPQFHHMWIVDNVFGSSTVAILINSLIGIEAKLMKFGNGLRFDNEAA